MAMSSTRQNPASQHVIVYGLLPDSGLHAMKGERHGWRPSRARLAGSRSLRNSSATPRWGLRGGFRRHRLMRDAPSLVGVGLEDWQRVRCGRRHRMDAGQGAGSLGTQSRPAKERCDAGETTGAP